VLAVPAAAVWAAPVLMISVDGMKPEYVTQAEQHGIHAPFLRSMMHDGAWAAGVTGVLPTVTYPSHTTLITGVPPAVNGIFANAIYDPERHYDGAWYWYAKEIHAQTLWAAAHAAGITTASVSWPVSVEAPVDWLIPEYWRGDTITASRTPSDRELIAAISRPVGMLDTMQAKLGGYMLGDETTPASDEIRTRFALEIIREHKPQFMTIHLASLDETEHETGPFSSAAIANLEAIDGMIARLAAAARAADPATIVVVVSDHGFAAIHHRVNMTAEFVRAGLITMSDDPNPEDRSITRWKAQVWTSSGTMAVMLHDPNDAATARAAGNLLHRLARDPANGIAEVLDHAEAVRRGGFPNAAWVVLLAPGFYSGDAETGPLVTQIEGSRGGHGFDPALPEMRSSFFATGQGVAHTELGQVNMLQIAPTIAKLLGVALPAAKAQPLALGAR
jgi:predicted AlkP superfamily pyrophosphatase or phosphodiesterase